MVNDEETVFCMLRGFSLRLMDTFRGNKGYILDHTSAKPRYTEEPVPHISYHGISSLL